MYRVLRLVLGTFLGRRDFRIVHISIQRNHLHLLVEAANRESLTAGMSSFTIRAAKAINRADGGCGEVFPYRRVGSDSRAPREGVAAQWHGQRGGRAAL